MLNQIAYNMHQAAVDKGHWGDPADLASDSPGERAIERDRDGNLTPEFMAWALPQLVARRNFGELLMLIVTEVAEAHEDWRDGKAIAKQNWSFKPPMHDDLTWRLNSDGMFYKSSRFLDHPDVEWTKFDYDKDHSHLEARGYTFKPVGIPSELADIIIRVLDICGAYQVDIDAAVEAKVAYNATRPHKHGRVR